MNERGLFQGYKNGSIFEKSVNAIHHIKKLKGKKIIQSHQSMQKTYFITFNI